ncbi:MAG: hypothetical protein JJU21_10955 [Salinarimonas sp.]|nr:hypothetical protein [Salinarimonas sp.]
MALTARPERDGYRGGRIALLFAGGVALLAGLFVNGCSGQIDEAQAALCRMTLPALNPAGSDIRIIRLARADEPAAIRIDYTVSVAADIGMRSRTGPRQGFVICRFDPVPFSEIEPRLMALETQDGTVSGASVYLMQRFWLRSPEAAAADPGR